MMTGHQKRNETHIFRHLLSFSRSIFSLRRVVNFLPISTPAPRLLLSVKRLERNARIYAAENESQSELEESSLSSYTPEGDSISLVPLKGRLDSVSDSSDSSQSGSTSVDLPRISVKYVGELPPKPLIPSSNSRNCPAIFAFDADLGAIEKYQSEVTLEDEGPLFVDPQLDGKRYRRIRARCDDWLAQSSRFYGVAPDSQEDLIEVAESEGQLSTPSLVIAEDSISQVAAKKAAAAAATTAGGNVGNAATISSPTDKERITQLEQQLDSLRAQLAQLILYQERDRLGYSLPSESSHVGKSGTDNEGSYRVISIFSTATTRMDTPEETVDSSSPNETTAGCDGYSDSGVMVSASSTLLVPQIEYSGSIPPPPPLPPPPPPPQTCDWRSKLLEKKGQNPSKTQKPAVPSGDMSQVLKELTSGAIKLRSVRRSAGGTPIREREIDPSRLDPAELIARALKAKFANARYELDSPESQNHKMNENNKENDNEDDFTPPPTPVFQTPMPLKSASRMGSVDAKQRRLSPEADVTPLFGRHLLRPVNREKLPTPILSELNFDTPTSSPPRKPSPSSSS